MKLVFLRHGQTKGNIEKRYVGTTEEGLCQEGKAELREKKRKWQQKGLLDSIEAVYMSPMLRCVETAELLFGFSCKQDRKRVKKFYIIKDFRECDFGDFEYKNYKELKENKQYQDFLDSQGEIGFPKGETKACFRKRCVEAFQNVMETAIQEEYSEIGLILHGGTIMAILEAFAAPKKEYYEWQVKNGEGFLGYMENTKHNGLVIREVRRLE